MKKLLWRCDDFGSATGANEGILRLARLGLPINVSVLICGPAARVGLEELASLGSHVCLGIHAAINSEWVEVKWGPVGRATRSTPLVDANGHFHPDYDVILKQPAEMLATEVEAQIETAKTWDIPFAYMDEHMCFAWVEGVAPHLKRLAAKHGLIFNRDIPGLPEVKDAKGGIVERMAQQVEAVKDSDPHLAVFHPAVDDASTKKFYLKGGSTSDISRERQEELDAFSSAAWRKLATGGDVKLMTYRDL